MFKEIANFGSLLKQAQQIGGQMGQISEEMKHRRVTGSAAGGMVEVDMNGAMEMLGCRVDPKLFEQNDRELIEDLVVAAVNQALERSKQMHAEALRNMTGGITLPGGLQEALAKFTEPESE